MVMKTISDFLSSKLNLTILQCLLYFVLGHMLMEQYTLQQFIMIFIIMLGIQFITHIKGVGHGMMLFQIMQEEKQDFIKFIKKMKKEKSNDK